MNDHFSNIDPIISFPGSTSSNIPEHDEVKQLNTPVVPDYGFSPPLEPGEIGQLGTYRIVKQIGQGGMGAVYLAVDQKLGRKLAIKIMLPRYAAQLTSKERFLREARAASQITHDNTVTIYEADEQNGIPFIAMQLLEGCSLEDQLKKSGNLNIGQILRVAHETALGLAAAHRCGLVHRDIKPANLWIESPSGRVKILDFGLARLVENPNEITSSGAVIGTPAFMSPEQAGGHQIDARTDLFSLGAVLYRLCTGNLPFQGTNTMAVLTALATKEPVPILACNPEIPASLAQLIHQLLAKNPSGRVQSADDVVSRILEITEQSKSYTPRIASSNITLRKSDDDLKTTSKGSISDNKRDFSPQEFGAFPTAKPPQLGQFAKLLLACSIFLAFAAAGFFIVRNNSDGVIDPHITQSSEPNSIDANPDSTAKNSVTPQPARETLSSPVYPVSKQPISPGSRPINDNDPQRKVAEWVLANGGVVEVRGAEPISLPIPDWKFDITGVTITSKNVTNDDLDKLTNLDFLESLNLSSSPKVTATGLSKLKSIGSLRKLQIPHINNSADIIGPLLSLQNLEEIDLPKSVSDDDLERLVRLKKLRIIAMRFSILSDMGLKNLSKLPNLEALDLAGGKNITDKGAFIIAQSLNLRYISLQNTKVGPVGWGHLSKLPNLKIVSAFSQEPYTKEVLAAISQSKTIESILFYNDGDNIELLKNHPTLSVLNIENPGIGDDVIPIIASMKSLKTLRIMNTGISKGGFDKLKLTLPNCTITSNFGTREIKSRP